MNWKTAIFLASVAHGSDNIMENNDDTQEKNQKPFIEMSENHSRTAILHDSTIPSTYSSFTFKFPIEESAGNNIIPIFENLASNTYKHDDKKLEYVPELDSFVLSVIPAHRPHYYKCTLKIDEVGKKSFPIIWNPIKKFPRNARFEFDLIAGKICVESDFKPKEVKVADKAYALVMLNLVDDNGKVRLNEKIAKTIVFISAIDPSTVDYNPLEKFSKDRFEEILSGQEEIYFGIMQTETTEINLKSSQSQRDFEIEHYNLIRPSQYDDKPFNKLTFTDNTPVYINALKQNQLPENWRNLGVHEYTADDALDHIMSNKFGFLKHSYFNKFATNIQSLKLSQEGNSNELTLSKMWKKQEENQKLDEEIQNDFFNKL